MIKILSANIGGIDGEQKIVEQSYPTDYHQVTHSTGIFSSTRMESKWYKTIGVLDTDMPCVWIDGTVNVISPDFAKFCAEALEQADFLVPQHPNRMTIGEEYNYILDNMDKEYLKVRYGDEDWGEEMEAFDGNFDALLVNPRVFICNAHKEPVKRLLREWWVLIKKYTVFDQTQLSYLLHKGVEDMRIGVISWPLLKEYVEVVKHKDLK